MSRGPSLPDHLRHFLHSQRQVVAEPWDLTVGIGYSVRKRECAINHGEELTEHDFQTKHDGVVMKKITNTDLTFSGQKRFGLGISQELCMKNILNSKK